VEQNADVTLDVHTPSNLVLQIWANGGEKHQVILHRVNVNIGKQNNQNLFILLTETVSENIMRNSLPVM
jgi:hypothetical protein